MRKVSRFLVFLIIFTMLSGVIAYAAPTGNGTSTSSSTTDGKYGAVAARTGFLIYVTDSQGNRQSIVTFVPYKQIDSTVKGFSVDYTQLTTRFGDGVDRTMNEPVRWSMGAWTPVGSGYDLVGNGQKIKEFLLRGDNIKNVLIYYLRFGANDLQNFMDNDWVLNVEPVMWAGLYQGANFQRKYFAGTAYNWAQVTDGTQCVSFMSHCVLPTSAYYEEGRNWLGLTAPSGVVAGRKLSSEDIQNYAYNKVVHSDNIEVI